MDSTMYINIFAVVFLAALAAHVAFRFMEYLASYIEWRMRNWFQAKHSKCFMLFVAVALLLAVSPEYAQASAAIADFATPLQKVLDTITGPIGRIIAIAGVLICGVILTMRNEEISEGMKGVLKVVFGICFIALATNIVDAIFSFSGAVI